mgnify:CR=1 FL=1
MSLRRLALLGALAAAPFVSPSVAQAQASPLVGTWAMEYPAGIRNENGAVTPMPGRATVTFSVQGDSIIAELVPENAPGGPARRPSRLAAPKVTGNRVTFTQQSQARMNLNGEETVSTIQLTWVFVADGDALSGSLDRKMGEMEATGPLALSGTRQK